MTHHETTAEHHDRTQARLKDLLDEALRINGGCDKSTVYVKPSQDPECPPAMAYGDIPFPMVHAADGEDAAICLAVALEEIAASLKGLVKREWKSKLRGIRARATEVSPPQPSR